MNLPNILLILVALSVIATLIATMVALRSSKEAQNAIFPIVREEESQRAQRARVSIFLWVGITALLLGGWLASLQLVETADGDVAVDAPPEPTANIALVEPNIEPPEAAVEIEEQPAVASTAPPVVTSADAVTEEEAAPQVEAETQPQADAAPQVEAETQPQADAQPEEQAVQPEEQAAAPEPETENVESAPVPEEAAAQPPTAEPSPTPEPTPPSETVPAPADAQMGPIQFSAEITEDVEPVNPTDVFSSDIDTIYAVFPYSGMQEGLAFRAVWYQNGEELWRDETQWRWGPEARSFSFLRPPANGEYRLELYVNDSVLATGQFEIR